MPNSLQQGLHDLAELRIRLLGAHTAADVNEALAAALVPAWADALSLHGDTADAALPAAVWRRAPLRTWLSPADAPGEWVAFEVAASEPAPPAHRLAIAVAGADAPLLVVLERQTRRPPWQHEEMALLSEFVRLAEFALQNVEQHRRTLEARAVGDAAAHRWAAFARLSERLARAVTVEDVVAGTMAGVVPYLADWALLHVLTPRGTLERVGRCHGARAGERLLADVTAFPFGSTPGAEALERLGRTGRLLARSRGEEVRGEVAERERAALVALAPASVAVVPLLVGPNVLGALTLVSAESGQRYERSDLNLFASLAHQAALALNSARLYHEAERARMEREEVLAIVSHDLKNPLNTLGFAVAILQQEGVPEEKKAPQLGIMERALEQMDVLVRDLLDAARIDAGRFAVEPVPEHPGALVRDAIQRAAPLAEHAQVRLEAAAPAGLPPILVDRSRLLQVFANLLDNAISFTPANSTVWVRAQEHDDGVLFEVEDSGPGLDAEAAKHVFDRFWQARNSGRAGAGLGLAIARGIIESHGGRIGVRCEAGRGAVFHMLLPRAPQQSMAAR